MSEKINCGNCGMLLYFGEEIKRRLYMRAIPDEAAVLAAYGNACPRCGNPLSDGFGEGRDQKAGHPWVITTPFSRSWRPGPRPWPTTA